MYVFLAQKYPKHKYGIKIKFFLQPDSRFSLDRKDNGNYLIIGLARISDEGEVKVFIYFTQYKISA